MEQLSFSYSDEEQAWVTPEVTFTQDVYLMISLTKKGKVVMRQETMDGKRPRVPIKRHKDTGDFCFRMRVVPQSVKIQIFTSTEPQCIKYAYI